VTVKLCSKDHKPEVYNTELCVYLCVISFFGAEERLEDITGRILYIHVEYIHSEAVRRLMSFARECFLPVKVCTYRGHPINNIISRTVRVPTSYLTFRGPCIVIYFYSKTNQMHQFLKFILFLE